MRDQVDVVLVVPGNLVQVYQHQLAVDHAIEPPVFALLIAGYLLRHGVSVAIVDQLAEELENNQIGKRVFDHNPTLVVVVVYGYQPSASTQNMPAARAALSAINEWNPGTKTMLTGTHPAALPERTLQEEDASYVCDGDGAVTTLQLLRALEAGGSRDEIAKVGSLWYLADDDKTALHNPPAAFMDGFETLRMPWELLPSLEDYRAHDWHSNYAPVSGRYGYASLITTLGCPYHCEFCCIQTPFRAGERAGGMKPGINSYRYRNPEVVLADIQAAYDQGVRLIKVHDEMFVLNPRHVLKFCELVQQRFGDEINFWAYTRVDTTRPEFLDKLRAAGIRWLGVGIESANSTVRDGQDKAFNDDAIHAVVNRIHAAGINVGANFIFGLPHDTVQSMQETLGLAIGLNTAFANFYCAMAYPGSKLHEQASAARLRLPEDGHSPGWIGYSQHSYECQPLPTETVSAADVLKMRDQAWYDYYDRPEFRAMIEQKLGPAALATVKQNVARPRLKRGLLGDQSDFGR